MQAYWKNNNITETKKNQKEVNEIKWSKQIDLNCDILTSGSYG